MVQTGKITALYCRFSADDMRGESDSIAHQIEFVGSRKSCRTGSNHCHVPSVPLGREGTYIVLAVCDLSDCRLVFPVGGRLVKRKVQHAGFLAEGWTYPSREFRERVRLVQ